MPKLTIDHQLIEVPEGTKVIEAAGRLGIEIPRFCFHPALGAVGACRVCAVKFIEGPVKGVNMSCMIEATEGMVVSTTDPEAVEFRQHVIEWLMLNHPHDCPVCDEGGHCLLQDMTVSGGHGMRRYAGNKRTHNDQYLGPLIQHEMNRCIQCYRCVRYYREYSGYTDLGVMGIGSRVYYGRIEDGTLESPFAGNLVDICPTGVFTDKPSRFKGRCWDFQRTDSICIHCALGCHTVVSARYRDVVRQEARFSPQVNGHFICDRGRYGFYYAVDKDRPRRAHVEGRDTEWQEAMDRAAERLTKISRANGPDAVACVGSGRSSLGALAALDLLCGQNNWRGPVCWTHGRAAQTVGCAVSRLTPSLAVSLSQVAGADLIIVLGADPVNEAPMLATTLRQAHRTGARIIVADPRPVSLPFDFEHKAIRPGDLAAWIGGLIKGWVDRETLKKIGGQAFTFYDSIPPLKPGLDEGMDRDVESMRQCWHPVIVCGTDTVSPEIPEVAADLALILEASGKKAGLFYQLPAANSFGATLAHDAKESVEQVLADIEKGSIKALVIVEYDLFRQVPRERLEQALSRLEFLVVLDYLNTPAVDVADVFLPTLSVFEAGGLFINQEGRAQQIGPAFSGGTPITETGRGDHPPRRFRADIPGAMARSAEQTLGALNAVCGKASPEGPEKREALPTAIQTVSDFLRSITAFPGEGIRPDRTSGSEPFCHGWDAASPAENDDFDLLLVEQTFGTEPLSSFSKPLREREGVPSLLMHVDDAAELGLETGDRVEIGAGEHTLTVGLAVATQMARGVLILPRHHSLAWQNLAWGDGKISRQDIRKVEEGESR
jgi:NADH-quinone oxidoreductase subunit G